MLVVCKHQRYALGARRTANPVFAEFTARISVSNVAKRHERIGTMSINENIPVLTCYVR